MTQPRSEAEPEFLTRQGAADYLHVNPQTIDRLVRDGHLTRYRLPSTGKGGTRGHTLYRTKELRALPREERGQQ